MRISVDNTSFKSRNAEIRFADDLARRVNQAYPRLSSTLIEDLNNARRFPRVNRNLCDRIYLLRDIIHISVLKERDDVSCLRSMMNVIKKYKMGNCAESACLSSIALEVNGIKVHHPAVIRSEFDDDLDHAVVLVPNNGKPYIVDSWLGFADYVPKAFERYQKEFHNHFDFCLFGTDKMILKQAKIDVLYALKNVNQKLLGNAFPELLKKRTRR